MAKLHELQHLSLATTYEIDENFDSDKFIKMRLRVCHDGKNPNGSSFEVSTMENAEESIKNIPILAHVIYDENGQPQFGGHDMVLEEHKMQEGEYKLIYKETPIGLVPESNNYTIEKYKNKNYVFVDCYIWRSYANYAEDIINRDGDIKLSMEIIVDGYNYNAKEKVYNITDYRYQGITFLNKNYKTGMEDALATIESFKLEDHKEKFIMMMEELKESLSDYNINNSQEGGSSVNENVKALLEKFNLTEEDLTFDITDMTIEQIEEKLNELHSKEDKIPDVTNDVEPEKFIKSFELSHSDIRYALYKLLMPVEDEDNEWYFIDQVYDNRFEYVNWEGTKIYRQGYKKDGDNVEFEGERIQLFQERLTAEEKEALDKMRANYSSFEEKIAELSEYKNKNEFEIFKSDIKSLIEDFEVKLKDNDEFKKLKENINDSFEKGEKFLEYNLLEKELFAIVGRMQHKVKPKKQNFTRVAVIEEDKPTGYFGSAEKYIKK